MSAIVAYIVGIIFVFGFIKIAFNFFRAVFLRVRFYINLKKLCGEKGYTLCKKRKIFASFFCMTSKADFTVNTGKEHYSVRVITCFAHKRAYHFINEKCYIRFTRFGYVLPMSKAINKIRFFEKMKKMPPLKKTDDENIKQILLLNPSPMEVFQLEGNRMNKSLVRDGSEMYGWIVYSGLGFLKYLNSVSNS